MEKGLKIGVVVILVAGLVSVIWLRGGTIYYWDSVFPLHPLKDLIIRNYTWNLTLYRGYPSPPNRFLIYIGTYLFFDAISLGNIALAQQFLVYMLFTCSGLSIFLLLRKIFLRIDRTVSFIYPLIGALFYMFNFFSAYYLSEIYIPWFLYSFFPLFLYFLLIGIEKHISHGKGYKELVLSILVIELMSSSFYEAPYIVFFIFLSTVSIYSMIPIFESKDKGGRNKVVRFLLIFFIAAIMANLWWETDFLFNVAIEVHSLSLSFQITGIEFMYKHLLWPFQFFVITSMYPTVRPIVGNNTWSWIGLYGDSVLTPLFLFISFLLLIFTYLPLLTIRMDKSLLPKRTKKTIYFSLIFVTFFVLLGQNPLMGYVYDLVSSFNHSLIPYLYAVWYPFSEMVIVFFIAILLPVSIFEFIQGNYKLNSKRLKRIRSRAKFAMLQSRRNRKIAAIIVLTLILCIYPWYMYTPQATQDYNTGSGYPIVSVVHLPGYFLNATDYISSHAGIGGTLILPESYDFLSMNFSSHNSFANDQHPSYLTGTPIMLGSNTLNEIQSLLYNPGLVPRNLSIFLNSLNVKYILLNTIERNSANGYVYYNLSHLQEYLGNQSDLVEVGKFGPILIYENRYYEGIFSTLAPVNFSPSVSSPIGLLNVTSSMRNMKQSGNIRLGHYNFSDGVLHFNVAQYNSSDNPVRFYNTASLGVNISVYHYLIITLQSSNNTLVNVLSKTFFSSTSHYALGSTLLANMNYSLYNSTGTISMPIPGTSISGKNYTTYIYPLFHQTYDNQFSYPLENNTTVPTFSNGDILNHLVFLFSLKKSLNAYFTNISTISFAKYISSNDIFIPMSSNPKIGYISNGNLWSLRDGSSPPRMSYREVNPTYFKVSIKNSSSPYLLMFKQNYNPNWVLETSSGRVLNSDHQLADGYANSWIINLTGNYTLKVIYSPQIIYQHIEYISLAFNVIMVSVIPIIYWRKRKNANT